MFFLKNLRTVVLRFTPKNTVRNDFYCSSTETADILFKTTAFDHSATHPIRVLRCLVVTGRL